MDGPQPLAGGNRGGSPPRIRTATAWFDDQPERNRPVHRRRRVGLGRYLQEAAAETRMIALPGAREVRIYATATGVVLVFAAAVVAAIDIGWSQTVLSLFGR